MTAEASDEVTRVTLEAWLVTDVGVVRDHNEDSAHMEPSEGFFIVADGMGGHAAGEVASAMAVDTVKQTLTAAKTEIDSFKKSPSDAGRRAIVQLLQNAVLQAHQAVFSRGQTEQDKQGMGTTLDVVLVAGAEAFVAHVGDSRTYLVREGKSSQITTDHTVAEVLVIEGKLTIEEAQVSPLRTILVNAIGVSADVGVEMAHVTLKKGDRLLLCSDGLHDYYPVEDEIAQRMSAEQPGEALKEMVELAKTRGGHDNITGVAVHVVDVKEAAVPERVTGDDSTQPVDVTGNPFSAEESTQTAAANALLNAAPTMPTSFKPTQPMRSVDPNATTVPPPIKATAGSKVDPDVTTEPKQALPATDAKPSSDGTPAPAPATSAKADDKASAKPDDKASDGVPGDEAATADTGRAKKPEAT